LVIATAAISLGTAAIVYKYLHKPDLKESSVDSIMVYNCNTTFKDKLSDKDA
jgi:hypothetical protein